MVEASGKNAGMYAGTRAGKDAESSGRDGRCTLYIAAKAIGLTRYKRSTNTVTKKVSSRRTRRELVCVSDSEGRETADRRHSGVESFNHHFL